MKIAFIGNYQYSCGSSNTLLGYIKAGKVLGHDIRVSEFGFIDRIIRETIPVAKKSWIPDILAILYESYPFLEEKVLDEIRFRIPRTKILVIDPDGRYAETKWKNLYESLTDIVLQPTLNKISEKKVNKFIYYGIDTENDFLEIKKDLDFLYLGNNWYRWKDIRDFINSITSIRYRLKKVALMGNYWGNKTMKGFKRATTSDPAFLKRNNVKIIKPPDYGKVEESMSRALINPIYVRSRFYKLKFVTPRMFETFAANTVAVIPKNFKHAVKLYGEDASKLVISNISKDKILNILDNYQEYLNLCKKIRSKLTKEHSYKVRLNELIKFV